DTIERRERFFSALAARPHDEPLLQSLRAAARDVAEVLMARPEREALRLRLIETDDALKGRSLRTTEEWANVVAEHSACRLGLDPDDALPRLLGSSTTCTPVVASSGWSAPTSSPRA